MKLRLIGMALLLVAVAYLGINSFQNVAITDNNNDSGHDHNHLEEDDENKAVAKFDLGSDLKGKKMSNEDFEKLIADTPEHIADIDGKLINNRRYIRILKQFQEELLRSNQQISVEHFEMQRKNIATSIIEQQLLLIYAEKADLKLDQAAVESELAAIKNSFPSEELFENRLVALGLTKELLRDEVTENFIAKQYVDEFFFKKVTITQKAVRDYYDQSPPEIKNEEQVQASHILVKLSAHATEKETEEALAKIENIKKMIEGGKDFAEIAKQESDDPGSKGNGGDLGLFGKGAMVKEFEDAAFNTAVGQLSDIIRTKFGFHILKVYKKEPAYTKAYSEVKDSIETKLKTVEVQSRLKKLLDEKLRSPGVKIFI
ncbi:MAG: peptidylprolyl isomerase [Nitrospinota bacterium]